MQSDCIREASKACFNTCCVNPLALPDPPPASASAVDPRRSFVSAILSSIQPDSNFTNHESLPSLPQLLSSLKNAVPNYLNTVLADSIRDQEYHHLSLSNRVFLDYVGHGLFSHSQKQSSEEADFFDVSYTSVKLNSYLLYGNQESQFQTWMKKRIMRYMNVFEEDYSSVFTANQSSAFKILADSFPFSSHPNLLTVYDYENDAVELMIERAKTRGARPQSALFSWPNLRINSRKLRKIVVSKSKKPRNRGLFVFPLQSRTSGARYPYQWMNLARENGWHVLLDASALGAKEMETLGLSLFQPDFIICSFYKIFGENPSGFCCLFIKKSSVPCLSQSPTSMGIVSITNPSKFQQEEGEASCSEIVELDEEPGMECRALDHADTLGLILISSRVRYLVNWLVNALLSLEHPHSGNGLPLITIYGPRIKLNRGPAIAFNVCDWKGERVDPILVQKLADRNNISLTLGFLKNVYFSEDFQVDKSKVLENRGKTEEKKRSKQDCGIRVVSVSLVMLSNFEDIYRVWAFVSRFLDADFVEKERWRYTALNQTTVEV
ncbi:hypothetical protein ACS0TY_004438 [Phlomoides rotata]